MTPPVLLYYYLLVYVLFYPTLRREDIKFHCFSDVSFVNYYNTADDEEKTMQPKTERTMRK